MKSILSPYNDVDFNKYLLSYIKKSLRNKCLKFNITNNVYRLDDNSKTYTNDDIINSIHLKNRLIYFSNQKLINHAVYDLCQRFWYEEVKNIYNMIHILYIEYKSGYISHII